MYAELLPDILASRVPKTADGKAYPVAGRCASKGAQGEWRQRGGQRDKSRNPAPFPRPPSPTRHPSLHGMLAPPALPAVWTSTLQRTIITASGLAYPKVQWKALDEIQVRGLRQ